MPAISLQSLRDMIQHFLPPPDPSISPPREVILLVDLGDGNRRVLSCDADVQELIDRQGGRCEFIDVEVRELFPGSPTAVGPAVAASRSLRLPIAAFARPGRNVPSSPPSEGSRRGMHGGRPRPRSAGASFQYTKGASFFPGTASAKDPFSPSTGMPSCWTTTAPPSVASWSVGNSPKNSPFVGAAGTVGAADGQQVFSELSPPRREVRLDVLSPSSPSSPSRVSRRAELSKHLREAVGLRGEYEHLRSESLRRRQALVQLLETRQSAHCVYELNEALRARPPASTHLKTSKEGNPEHCFSSVLDPEKLWQSTGPTDWDKGQFWPVKTRDVPKLAQAIKELAELEGVANVRLEDQQQSATWTITNAIERLSEEGSNDLGQPMLIPRPVLLESRWLKFGEFSEISFRLYPAGDAGGRPNCSTVYIWMASPPGLTFTFRLRVGRLFNSPPCLWQARMLHCRLELRWPQLCEAISSMILDGHESLPMTMQVLQWHGPEDNPADSPTASHTSVSLALEMLQGAASASATALAERRAGSWRRMGTAIKAW